MGPTTDDVRWVRQAFIVDESDLDSIDQSNRTFTSASIKFTDTTLGGNFCINPPPQFTRNADIRPKNISRSPDSAANDRGMGRYYSEAIDDHNQIIYLRAGLPAFNSIFSFLSEFYSADAGQLARTGRSNSLFYAVGYATGFVVSILSWKLLAVHMLGIGANLLNGKPRSKFYYSKPVMPLYWNAVQTMVNQIAVNKGIVPAIPGTAAAKQMNSDAYEFSSTDIDKLHSLFPAMFNSGGSIDVYAMANRAQRLARQQDKMVNDQANAENADVIAQMSKISQTTLAKSNGMDYRTYLNLWLGTEAATPAGSVGSDSAITSAIDTATTGSSTAAQASAGSTETVDSLLSQSSPATKFMNFLKAEWDDGSAFASFRVDATGAVSESFSSSLGESDMATKFNNISSSARNMEFDFASGNLIGGAIGEAVGAVKDAAMSVVEGAADSLKLSGLLGLAGGAFVDIPKHWVSSAANLPHSSYSIKLVSPYGNVFSQLMNIYIPLSMLLAFALPISTGKQSYSSPFLCELYDQGRNVTRLGMMTQLSINRGIGNTGWNGSHQALGIEVNFEITDLSSIMSMPIQGGFNFKDGVQIVTGAVQGGLGGASLGSLMGPVGTAAGAAGGAALGAAAAAGVFDDDNTFTDYMNVLASLSLSEMIYPLARWKRNLNQKLAAFESWKSTSHMASFMGSTFPSRVVGAFMRGVQR